MRVIAVNVNKGQGAQGHVIVEELLVAHVLGHKFDPCLDLFLMPTLLH